MSIVATCGHEITVAWMYNPRSNVIRKSQSRECRPGLSFEGVCPDCRADLLAKRLGFATRKAADNLLERESATHPPVA